MLWPGCGQAQLCPKVLTSVDELIHVNLCNLHTGSSAQLCSVTDYATRTVVYFRAKLQSQKTVYLKNETITAVWFYLLSTLQIVDW